MKPAIIYKSDYGSTKYYAIKISVQLRCDILDVKNIDVKKLEDYDTFILCTNIINNRLGIMPFVKKHIELLRDKQIMIVANCITNNIKLNNFLIKQFVQPIPIFYLEGSVNSSTHLLHTIGILKSRQYYKKHPELLNKIKHGSIPKNSSCLDEIISYSKQVMNISLPTPVQENRCINIKS